MFWIFFDNIHWCCVNVLDFFSEFFDYLKICYRVWSTRSTLGMGVPDILPICSSWTQMLLINCKIKKVLENFKKNLTFLDNFYKCFLCLQNSAQNNIRESHGKKQNQRPKNSSLKTFLECWFWFFTMTSTNIILCWNLFNIDKNCQKYPHKKIRICWIFSLFLIF